MIYIKILSMFITITLNQWTCDADNLKCNPSDFIATLSQATCIIELQETNKSPLELSSCKQSALLEFSEQWLSDEDIEQRYQLTREDLQVYYRDYSTSRNVGD